VGTVGRISKTKENSMKWFWSWVARKMQRVEEEKYATESKMIGTARATLSRGSDIDSDDGLNITVRSALGGKIVSFRHYDHKNDRSYTKLYVIPDDMDFEKELGKMITLESMR
jgi:hypothetical protein